VEVDCNDEIYKDKSSCVAIQNSHLPEDIRIGAKTCCFKNIGNFSTEEEPVPHFLVKIPEDKLKLKKKSKSN
jgi:hypothetical protein